jgi:hypothetical protein
MSIRYKYERVVHKTDKKKNFAFWLAHDEINLQLNYHLWAHFFLRQKNPKICD